MPRNSAGSRSKVLKAIRTAPGDAGTNMLLAEHERIAALFQSNVAIGEQLVSTYLTIVSIAVALLVGFGQLGASGTGLLPVELTLLVIIVLVGAITFERLVERKIRGIEYLRAINRLHRRFVDLDPGIERYLYWPAHDDRPPLLPRGSTLGGLRDLVAGLNSIFLALVAGIAVRMWLAEPRLAVAVLVGVGVGLAVWLAQSAYNRSALRRAEEGLSKESRFRQDAS